jgi:hypothetical protein
MVSTHLRDDLIPARVGAIAVRRLGVARGPWAVSAGGDRLPSSLEARPTLTRDSDVGLSKAVTDENGRAAQSRREVLSTALLFHPLRSRPKGVPSPLMKSQERPGSSAGVGFPSSSCHAHFSRKNKNPLHARRKFSPVRRAKRHQTKNALRKSGGRSYGFVVKSKADQCQSL